MKSFALCFLALLPAAAAVEAAAQTPPPPRDPRIERIVREISPARIAATVEKLASFGTRHTLSDTTDPAHGIGAARRWVKAELERSAARSGGRMTVSFDTFTAPASPRIPRPAVLTNVVAMLRPADTAGSAGRGAIVLSAHLDSRATDVLDASSPAPGADDDGSGIALVLECARALSAAEVRVPVFFIAFTGEEQGLLGSRHWAGLSGARGLRITAELNNDIVGGIRGGDGRVDCLSVRVFSAALSPLDTGAVLARRVALGLENDGASRSLARYAEEVGELYVPGFNVRMVYRGDRFLRGGDHTPFHERGVAAVRFSEADEDFDHQHQNPRTEGEKVYGDLPRFVNAGYCANVARVNAAVAASLAFAPPPPREASLITSSLAYDSRLHWSPEPGAAGYFVRWRETTSSVWQSRAFTADTSLTLAVGKDGVLFGIQAVSPEGDPSLYALPLPAR